MTQAQNMSLILHNEVTVTKWIGAGNVDWLLRKNIKWTTVRNSDVSPLKSAEMTRCKSMTSSDLLRPVKD